MRENAQLLLLDGPTVQAALDPTDVIAAVKEAFCLHSQSAGRVFPIIRERLHTGGIFGIKAGDVASQDLLGFKAAGFWSANRGIGGEPHQATVMLFDPSTGRPQCIMDGNAITTERTGAAGALGLSLLARKDSTRLCVFGSGVQAKAQVSYALRVLPSLERVEYVTFNDMADASFENNFKGKCDIQLAKDRNIAVSESDVVITATPGAGPLFEMSAVREGTHFNCVGTDTKGKRELPAGVLSRAKVVVDDAQQARTIGEVQWEPGTSVVELGQLLSGLVELPRAHDDVTVFDMTGIALQDLTVARYLFQRAIRDGAGTAVAWPW